MGGKVGDKFGIGCGRIAFDRCFVTHPAGRATGRDGVCLVPSVGLPAGADPVAGLTTEGTAKGAKDHAD